MAYKLPFPESFLHCKKNAMVTLPKRVTSQASAMGIWEIPETFSSPTPDFWSVCPYRPPWQIILSFFMYLQFLKTLNSLKNNLP